MSTKRIVLAQIRGVREVIEADLAAQHADLGTVGRGLAREGFIGGYLEALSDVEQALIGNPPSRNGWALWLKARNRNPLAWFWRAKGVSRE